MGSAERREREKQGVRQAIIDGARSIMSERGYEGLTMRAVADRIEYSPAAIYKHFADREDLVRALCACDFYAFAQVLLPTRPKSDDPLEPIRAIGHAYAEFAMRYPEQFRVMFMTPKPIDQDIIERGNPEQDSYYTLEQAVAVAQGAGRFSGLSPAIVAQTCWAAERFVEFEPLSERVETAMEAILAGLQVLADERAKAGRRRPSSARRAKRR
jgi:AcrR family transcriptional regulator